MNYRAIIVGFFAFLALGAFDSHARSSDEIAKYEQSVEAQIKDAKKSPEDKYYIYALFGRELLGLGKLDLARKYYEKALAQPSSDKVDKSESYYNLLYISYAQGADKKELVSLLDKVKKTIVKGDQGEGAAKALIHWEEIILGKSELNESLLNSFYGSHYAQVKVKELVQEKKFREALQIMPASLKDNNIVEQVEKDILTKVVFPESKSFLCEEKLKKYPKSITYTMLICRYLLDKKSTPLEKIEKQIAKESSERLYWMKALVEVK